MQKNYKQINGKFEIFWIKNYRKIYEILYIILKRLTTSKVNLLHIQIYLHLLLRSLQNPFRFCGSFRSEILFTC